MTPPVGHAVRKAGFTSVQRAESARAPSLNFPALNFEVRIAYSSSIAHPGASDCGSGSDSNELQWRWHANWRWSCIRCSRLVNFSIRRPGKHR